MKLAYITNGIALFVLLVIGIRTYRNSQLYDVTYKVENVSGGAFVRIRYLEKVIDARSGVFPNLTEVSRPVTSLPWKISTRLPKGATVWLEVIGERGGSYASSITIEDEIKASEVDFGSHTVSAVVGW